MSEKPVGAGLVNAPPYDPSSELDPSLVEPVVATGDDLQNLAYFREQHARTTFRARTTLLAIIFFMLAGNMWLTSRANNEVMENLNQARLDQAALSETIETRVTALESQLESLTSQLQIIAARPADEPAPAE